MGLILLLALNLTQVLAKPPSLNYDTIHTAVRKQGDDVRTCYDRGARKNKRLQGRVFINFTIDPEGRASDAKVGESTLRNEKVEKCLLNLVKKVQFPKPEGKTVQVSYPFSFEPPPAR